MLTFPPEYFQSETRDGFYIDSKMKHAWAAQLEVLEELSVYVHFMIYAFLLTGGLY